MFIHIRSTQKNGFWRCGVFHNFEGKSHSQDAFTEKQWETLKNEPMLKLSEGKAEVVAPSNDAELVTRVAEAVKTLTHEDFGKNGKPKIGALRVLLDEDKAAITTDVLDEAWAILADEGFTAPEA